MAEPSLAQRHLQDAYIGKRRVQMEIRPKSLLIWYWLVNREKLLEMSFLDEERWEHVGDYEKDLDTSLAATLRILLIEALSARIDYKSQEKLSMHWAVPGFLVPCNNWRATWRWMQDVHAFNKIWFRPLGVGQQICSLSLQSLTSNRSRLENLKV